MIWMMNRFVRHRWGILVIPLLAPASGPALGAERKIVIAHRGASGYLPEHTPESKTLAHAMGADFIEQDVVLSKDNQPMVMHDLFLEAVTNVAQVFRDRARADGHYYAVDFTAEEIRGLRVSERVDPRTGQPVNARRFPAGSSHFHLQTLREEIELIQGLNRTTGRNAGIYVEIKEPAWHRAQGRDITRMVLAVLSDYGYRDRRDQAYVQCFDEAETRRVRADLASNLKLVQLLSEQDWPHQRVPWDRGQVDAHLKQIAQYADAIGPSMALLVAGIDEQGKVLVTPLAEQAHQLGLEVHPYTFRADALPPYADNFERLLEIFYRTVGVDGIFTDYPDRAVQFLKSSASGHRPGPR